MNVPLLKTAMAGIVLGAAIGIARPAAAPAELRALKTDRPPTLDGKLDDGCWRDAEPCGPFVVHPGDGVRTDSTEIKAAFDNTWLYVGVRCANDQLHRFKAKHRSHDDPVITDDSVELFLDPAGDGAQYFHYMLSFNNVRAEQRVRGGVKDRMWNLPWLSATTRDAGGWSGELAIPLYLLMSYGEASNLTFNVVRNQRRIQAVDGQGEIVSETLVSSSRYPVTRGFHEPDRFGRLRGIRPESLAVPFMASLESVTVLPFEMRGDGMGYGVTITVRNVSDQVGELEAVVTDRTAEGVVSEARQAMRVSGTAAPQSQTLFVPVTSLAGRDITVVLRDPATGNEWGRRVMDQPNSLRLMSAYLDRNYYTEEPAASAHVNLGLPADRLAGMTLGVRAGDREVGTVAAAPAVVVTFPISAWTNGVHALSVELRRGDGARFGSLPLRLVKRPPRPGAEWKIDHVNRVLLRNGQPFFGLGMIMAMAGFDPERITRQVAESGFNTYFMWMNWDDPKRGWSGFTTDDVKRHVALAGAHGLYFLARPEGAFGGPKGEYDGDWVRPYFATLTPADVAQEKKFLPTLSMLSLKGRLYGKARGLSESQKEALAFGHYQYHLPAMLDSIAAVRPAGNLLGYFLFDEPMSAQFPALLDFYGKIQDADGYHPQFVLFSGAPPKGAEHASFYDVLGQDPYWAPGGAGVRGWPRYVAAATAALYARAAARRAPVWIVLAAETFDGACRAYTTAEQECQTWLGLINGATCINYFRNDCIASRATWTTYATLNRIITELAPALTAPGVRQSVTYRIGRQAAPGVPVAYAPGAFDPETWTYPDIQAVLKRFPDGRAVLLAANCFDRPTRGEFALPGLAGSASNRLTGVTHPVRDGMFADDFKGYGIAAYDLDLPVGQTSVALTVSSVVNAGDLQASEATFRLPHYVRPGKKNILPNPSVEDATRPGYPDYFFSYGAVDPALAIGAPGAPAWGQVTNEAFHGAHSMLISCAAQVSVSRHGPAGVRFYCQPQHDAETCYTFSFYAKADRPGLGLYYGSEYGEQTFTLTTDWQRYSMPWTMPPRSEADLCRFQFKDAKQAGRIWLDALQVEQGAEATAFEE